MHYLFKFGFRDREVSILEIKMFNIKMILQNKIVWQWTWGSAVRCSNLIPSKNLEIYNWTYKNFFVLCFCHTHTTHIFTKLFLRVFFCNRYAICRNRITTYKVLRITVASVLVWLVDSQIMHWIVIRGWKLLLVRKHYQVEVFFYVIRLKTINI